MARIKSIKQEIPGYSSDVEEIHKYGIVPMNRTIFLEAEAMDETGGDMGITHNTAMRFIKNLVILQTSGEQSQPITVIMNTVGGDVSNGFAIYDAIMHCVCPITIKVYGNCLSMGCIILQAAAHRILAENASIMFHHGEPGCAGGSNSFESVNAALFDKELSDRADKIVMNAINRKREKDGLSPLTYNKFQEYNLKGKYMFPPQAIELGLADSIITENHDCDICDHGIKI